MDTLAFEYHLTTGDYDKHISSRPVLNREDACHLHSRGLLFPDGDGWLRISKEIMNRSSYPRRTTPSSIIFHQWNNFTDELKIMVMKECSDITLGDLARASRETASLAKVTLLNNAKRRFSRIPTFTFSKQTVQYLGYTEEKAKKLWEVWRGEAQRFGPLSETRLNRAFREALKVPFTAAPSPGESVQFFVNSSDSSDDWVVIMNKFGLTKEFQTAILHPEFKDIRSCHTFWTWFRETIGLRLVALDDLRDASFSRRLPQQTKSHMNNLLPRLENHVAISPVPNLFHNRRYPSQLILPPLDPRFYTFWKPIDMYRTRGDGSLLGALSPHHISDFCEPSAPHLALYTDRDVAEKMARYTSVRTNGFSRAAILKVSIPVSFIGLCEMAVLSCRDDDWKELVSGHRKFHNLHSHPTVGHVSRRQLIIGNVSSNGSRSFYKMDGWEDVGNEHVLEVEVEREGRKKWVKPMQWVFRASPYAHPIRPERAFWNGLVNVIQVEVIML